MKYRDLQVRLQVAQTERALAYVFCTILYLCFVPMLDHGYR